MNNSKLKHKKNINWQRFLFIVLTLAVPLVHFAIFYLYVNFSSFFMAFQKIDKNGNVYWTLENFTMVFDSFRSGGLGLQSLKNTSIYFMLGLITSIVFGTIWSYFSYKKIWFDTTSRVLRAGLGLMPSVIVITLLRPIFNHPTSPLLSFVTNITGITVDETEGMLADGRFANISLFIYFVWWGIGINYYIRGAMMRIPEDVIEYASLDGVTWYQEIWFIIMPMIWPTIVTLITLLFAGFINCGPDVYLFTGGKFGTSTMTYWLWVQQLGATEKSNSLYFVSALGIFVTAVFMPLVFLVKNLLGKLQEAVEY